MTKTLNEKRNKNYVIAKTAKQLNGKEVTDSKSASCVSTSFLNSTKEEHKVYCIVNQEFVSTEKIPSNRS